MKRILSLFLVFMMFTGVAIAASINGDFEGNPIVKLKSNGQEIKAKDVPAVIYNGRTMVPVYMLEELGLTASWDQKTYSVNVKLKSSDTDTIVISKQFIKDLQEDVSKHGGTSFQYVYAGGLSTFVEVTYHSKLGDINNDIDNIANISKVFLATDIGVAKFEYYVNNRVDEEVYIFREDIEDYHNGVINLDSFFKTWLISNASGRSSETKTSTNITPTPITMDYPELYSNDGKTYLGKLTTNKYDTDSVYNEYGTHGSKYATKSIWNEFGTYGSDFSSESAFNDFATKPPIIVFDGKVIGYLTTNDTKQNAISPLALYKWLKDNGY